MLNYTNKGQGLLDQLKVSDVGFELTNGEATAVRQEDAQRIIDCYTLEMCKQYRKDEVAKFADTLRSSLMSRMSLWEGISWPYKMQEAAAYLASEDESDAPYLVMEAQERGISLPELLAKAGRNSVEFRQMEARISGVEGKHRDAIDAIQTENEDGFAEVLAYNFYADWPSSETV